MKDGEASFVQQRRTVSHHGEGIPGMNEDVTADDRVEPAARRPAMNVGLDAADVARPFSGRASREGLECGRVDVH